MAEFQHTSPISSVECFGATYVATAGYDNSLALWQLDDGRFLASAIHDHLVNQCAFSRCGRFLVSASSDHSARVWSIPDLRLLAVLGAHDDDVEAVQFSPDSALVATASRDHQVRVFDWAAGKLCKIFIGHMADALSVGWTTARELVSCSDDGTVRVWDLCSEAEVRRVDLEGVQVDTLAIAGAEHWFAGTDAGDVVEVRGHDVRMNRLHGSGVKRLAVHRKSGRLLSTSYDRRLVVSSVNNSQRSQLVSELPASVWPRAATFASENRLIFGTFGSGYAELDLCSGRWDLSRVGPTEGINAVAYDGKAVFSIGDAGVLKRDGKVVGGPGSLCNFLLWHGDRWVTGGHAGQVFDARSGEVLFRYTVPLNCAASFRMGLESCLAVGTYSGAVLLLAHDASRRLVVRGEVKAHDNAVKGLAVSSGCLLSVCATGAVASHCLADLSLVWRKTDGHSTIANCAVAIPGFGFATVGRDRVMKIWRDEHPISVRTPHRASIKSIAVGACGYQLATGAYDGGVGVFDLQGSRWIKMARPTRAGISSLAAGPGAGEFFAGSYDGHVYAV